MRDGVLAGCLVFVIGAAAVLGSISKIFGPEWAALVFGSFMVLLGAAIIVGYASDP